MLARFLGFNTVIVFLSSDTEYPISFLFHTYLFIMSPGLCQSYIVAIPTCLYFVTEKTEINFLQIEVKNTNVPFNI